MVVRRLDVLVLVVLVTARVRIDTLADLVHNRNALALCMVDGHSKLVPISQINPTNKCCGGEGTPLNLDWTIDGLRGKDIKD